MKNTDSKNHVTGKSVYVDDIPVQTGTLYGAVISSPKAHGKILKLDFSDALAFEGVEYIFTYKDIPGENQIGGVIPDEPLFAEKEVHFIGQPIAFVVANSEKIAQKAAKKINIEIEEWEVVTDPREAQKKGQLLFPPRTFQMGDIANKWKECDYIFEGKVENGGQEHLYIETQNSYAYPMDNGSIKIHSSTQGATLVQKIAARVLGT
ncbi:MAG TPA: molybdopterin cofactor-binding domain-containing protein, partial [Bacteroidales bacterium]|nr:molybdopterin cofactor-binding domain-containing protein [Bacteroidales bacterium]